MSVVIQSKGMSRYVHGDDILDMSVVIQSKGMNRFVVFRPHLISVYFGIYTCKTHIPVYFGCIPVYFGVFQCISAFRHATPAFHIGVFRCISVFRHATPAFWLFWCISAAFRYIFGVFRYLYGPRTSQALQFWKPYSIEPVIWNRTVGFKL